MKKLNLCWVLLLTACGDPGNATPATGAEAVATATQAISALEEGDRSAMGDCDAIAADCAANADPADFCAQVQEHCAAFGDFLAGSSEPAKACWQGCIDGTCNADECSALGKHHEEGRGRGMKCLDGLRGCMHAPDACGAVCADVDFQGPFSKHGENGGQGPDGAGPGGFDGGPPSAPTGDAPDWSQGDNGAGPAGDNGAGPTGDRGPGGEGDFEFRGDAGAGPTFGQ